MTNRDPFQPKVIHMASKLGPNGQVSALCSRVPRAINLAVATWTIRPPAVTCAKCIKIMDNVP